MKHEYHFPADAPEAVAVERLDAIEFQLERIADALEADDGD